MLVRHDSLSDGGIMSSRLWAARIVVSAVLFIPLGWLALPGPAALAGSSPLAGSSALGGPTGLPRAGAGTPMPESLAVPALIRAAARRPAPLVTDAIPARTKRGLAAPPMTAVMLRANAVKQAMASTFLKMMSSREGHVKCTSRACRAGLPVARSLLPTQQPQINDYYCGPATVSESSRRSA
jgi:hypothetical protein